MQIEFQLTETDYLDHQLFLVTKKERTTHKMRNTWLRLSVGSLVLAIIFYVVEMTYLTYYFLIISALAGLFYPSYLKWKYKRHFASYVRQTYHDRINETETLKFTAENIESSNKFGEAKTKISSLQEISETSNHFFIHLSPAMSFIIPKRQIADLDQLRLHLQQLDIPIKDELEWKW